VTKTFITAAALTYGVREACSRFRGAALDRVMTCRLLLGGAYASKAAARPPHSMKGALGATLMILILSAFVGLARAQAPANGSATAAKPESAATSATAVSALQKTIEAYLRNLYALGPEVALTISAPKETVAGLLETTVDVKTPENTQTAKFYLSKDGKYLIRGDVSDLSKDPLAEAVQQIQTKGAPSLGDPKAPVTLVEFSDFECPVCRSLHDVLRGLLPNYPQVRVVFKDYPIEVLHPWARTAALAGHCAYEQDPAAFWKMYDAIYDHQDIISAENAWMKMTEYAGQAGLNSDAFRGCLASQEARAAVDASRANGQQIDVNSTPTVFVNGRRMVGADARLLEQYIQYELAKLKPNKSADKK
jgi:protein-disulfide isomerase